MVNVWSDSCCLPYLPLALPQTTADPEQFIGGSLVLSASTVTVQAKQNSPSNNVTVFEVTENKLPPIKPLHS